MDPELLEALADILADAVLADLEAEIEAEQAVPIATAESPRELAVRRIRTSRSPSRASHPTPLTPAIRAIRS